MYICIIQSDETKFLAPFEASLCVVHFWCKS